MGKPEKIAEMDASEHDFFQGTLLKRARASKIQIKPDAPGFSAYIDGQKTFLFGDTPEAVQRMAVVAAYEDAEEICRINNRLVEQMVENVRDTSMLADLLILLREKFGEEEIPFHPLPPHLAEGRLQFQRDQAEKNKNA